MARKKTRKRRKSRPLVAGHLEKVSSRIFEEYPMQLTDLIGKQHGIYALYKGQRLYYVGLAIDLRRRIQQHQEDKHSNKWDRFSLYLIRKADHIKEIESVVMRIADPAGNTSRGRFPKAENLKEKLDKQVKAEQKEQRKSLFGDSRRKSPRTTKRPTRRASRQGKEPVLANYVSQRLVLKAKVKKKVV